MRARAIRPGRDYWLRVRITPVRPLAGSRRGGFPGCTVRQRVTVIDVAAQAGRAAVVTVEATRWRCINAHWFPNNLSRAMIDGQLRYRPQPHRWTVPVRHILAPAPERTSADAATGRAPRREAGRARQAGRAS